MINDKSLAMCKRNVKIVNVARGGIIEEEALLRALESGHVAGAALDVFEEEPPQNTELLRHPKVICTPHLGASTKEAQARVAEEISLQFLDLTEGKVPHGLVKTN